MNKNLTTSNIERQNVLNNSYALSRIQRYVGLPSIEFDGDNWLTKQMVADFFEVDSSTVDRYLEKYSNELKHNGYVLMKGKRLKELKLQFAPVINVGSKTTQLGLFNFRSFLNLAMLLKNLAQESWGHKNLGVKILGSPISLPLSTSQTNPSDIIWFFHTTFFLFI